MKADAAAGVPVTFVKGVLDDVRELTATSSVGPGLHPELANCRRVRFDIPWYSGKPRFRLIYRNEPTDGAPAECRWLTVAPRAGLRAHRKARQRLQSN